MVSFVAQILVSTDEVLRTQHHMRRRMGKCTVLHKVMMMVMMAMIEMMMIVLPLNDKREER